MQSDPDYKRNQQASNKRWQKAHPSYWQTYRSNNPDYVRGNREQQRIRDSHLKSLRKRSHLAKSDALSSETLVVPGLYWLSSNDPSLAKSDAILVRINVVSGSYSDVSHLAKRPPYIPTG